MLHHTTRLSHSRPKPSSIPPTQLVGIFRPENEWTRQAHLENSLGAKAGNYTDGSIESDLPMQQLSELFNVIHFIVSQVINLFTSCLVSSYEYLLFLSLLVSSSFYCPSLTVISSTLCLSLHWQTPFPISSTLTLSSAYICIVLWCR